MVEGETQLQQALVGVTLLRTFRGCAENAVKLHTLGRWNRCNSFGRSGENVRIRTEKSTRRLIFENYCYLCSQNGEVMQFDLIYPEDENKIREVPCVIAASYFDAEELIGFGVDPSAPEVNAPFADDNEFEKVFKLWESPSYLRKFFADSINFFEQDYWEDITEDEFVQDVTKSLNRIRKEFINLFNDNKLHTVVEPLAPEEEDLRLHQSIRVKIKQGWIHKRLAFRFYAIEIEEEKCYLITGAAIKIHKDMLKAPNTTIEKRKMEFALEELVTNGIDTKELFLDFVL